MPDDAFVIRLPDGTEFRAPTVPGAVRLLAEYEKRSMTSGPPVRRGATDAIDDALDAVDHRATDPELRHVPDEE